MLLVPPTLLLKLALRSWLRLRSGWAVTSGDIFLYSHLMSSRRRTASVEGLLDRPDFRSKLVRDLIPDPPDNLSAHHKRQWRQDKWQEIFGAQANLQVQPPPVAAQQPRAKARAAAYFGGGVTRRARYSCSSRCCKSLWRLFGGGSLTLVMLCMLAVYGGAEGPLIQFGRLLGVAADLGEATSVAAGQAVNMTGALATAATDVISSATSNGLNSAENIWRGVDISGLSVARCAGIMTLDDEHVLAQWLNSSAAYTLVPCLSNDLRDQMVAAASSVSLSMTSLQTSTEALELENAFNTTKVWAQLLPNGRLQLHYEQIHLSYAVEWANPLWSHWALDIGSEQEQILRLLRRAIVDLPSATPASSGNHLELEVKFAWPMLRSRLRVWIRSMVWQLAQQVLWLQDATLQGLGAVNCGPLWWSASLLFSVLVSLFLFRFGSSVPLGQCIEIRLALLDGVAESAFEPPIEPPVPVVSVTEQAPAPEVREESVSVSSSSDGSFSKISAIRVSDDSGGSSGSEYSYLLATDSDAVVLGGA